MLTAALAIDQKNSHQIRQSRDLDVFTLIVRAYDLGVPVMFSTISVRVYPPESKTRSVTFVLPGHNIDRKKTEDILSTITGGRVIIHDIHPYNNDLMNDQNVNNNNGYGGNFNVGDDNRIKKEMWTLIFYIIC